MDQTIQAGAVTPSASSFFSFQGRIGRLTYFLQAMALYVVAMIGYGLAVYGASAELVIPAIIGGLIALVFGLMTLFPAVRRLHDVELSGWWILLGFVPIVSLGLGLYLLFKKGTDGSNEYGPDPLAA